MLMATHYYRGRYPRHFRRSRPRRHCLLCGRDPATQYVRRLKAWLCATCQAIDRVRLLRRFAEASGVPPVAEWASWELDRIAAALEMRRP